MSISQISKRLDAILGFMEPYWPWVNCHMVNFITDKHWETFVPVCMREELEGKQDINECIESIFWSNTSNGKYSEIRKFIEKARSNSIENFQEILISRKALEKSVLNISQEKEQKPISIKEFLSEKKRHEVEITASLVNDLIQGTHLKDKQTVIVDAGDGKGYLSSRLALEFGHNVLGIDSNPNNTENALERNKKLKKAWNSLKERAELESKGITPPRRGRQKQKTHVNESKLTTSSSDNYKTIDRFITTDLNLETLIEEAFPNASQESFVCLTGLHTCGNLAATCLKLFHQQPQCKVLCNIGCCYHLIRELYSGQEFFGNKHVLDLNQETGFPLSSYMQKNHVKLGRNARMLAVQSVERTKANKDLPNISLHFRSLLEVLVCEIHPELKDAVQVGKLRKFNNFEEYVELCQKKYPLLEDITKERIKTVAEEYKDYKSYLDIFYLIRMSFAPVLESAILLDRLLYLLENGHSKSYILPLFDAVVSPRRFAIISIKD